jgi:uncharacterized protein YndB with AHSA1/START domain
MTAKPLTHATFVVKRSYDASPKRVFSAFADPEVHDRWFVHGDGWKVAEYSHDFRVGGQEHGRFAQSAGGAAYHNDTTYYDIVENERIIMAYAMSDGDKKPFSVSVATVEFRVKGTGTELVFTEQGTFIGDGDAQVKAREDGWKELFNALGKELNRSVRAA